MLTLRIGLKTDRVGAGSRGGVHGIAGEDCGRSEAFKGGAMTREGRWRGEREEQREGEMSFTPNHFWKNIFPEPPSMEARGPGLERAPKLMAIEGGFRLC